MVKRSMTQDDLDALTDSVSVQPEDLFDKCRSCSVRFAPGDKKISMYDGHRTAYICQICYDVALERCLDRGIKWPF